MANADFIQDYVIYEETLDSTEVIKQLASQKSHRVIVSHVYSASNIHIQIVENLPRLDKLMDDLENVYLGLGASVYDMPESYILVGRICASVFPLDKNWHRCQIQSIYPSRKQAYVTFIDYGGHATVSYTDIKFLAKEFEKLPAQAILARLANVKTSAEWGEKEINYFLNRVMGKCLLAEIIGYNDIRVSVDLFDFTTQDNGDCKAGTKIHINSRVVMDGFGTHYDETQEIEVFFNGITLFIILKSQCTKFKLFNIRNILNFTLQANILIRIEHELRFSSSYARGFAVIKNNENVFILISIIKNH